MTFLLLKAIETFLWTLFAKMVFRAPGTEEEAYRPPDIKIGALPPKRSGENGKDFPFIVIRPVEGEDNEDDSTATVKITFGVYTEEGIEGGFNDVTNMVDRARRGLLQTRFLDKKYVLNLPLRWTLGDEDSADHPHPYYHGAIITKWSTPPVEQILPPEDAINIFGSGYPAENG